MDIGEQKDFVYRAAKAAVKRLLEEGVPAEDIVESFVEHAGRDMGQSVPQEKLREVIVAVIAQVKKDDTDEWDRRTGM